MGDAGEIRLLIIADDLTGSNDAGAQFAKRGIRSVVLVNSSLSELPRAYPVVVVNTESRHVPPEEAAQRVAHVARLGVQAGVPHLFKKTDSTLRGNIAAEIKALLEVTGERSIPFVPAFPEMGRTTRDGTHYVNGVPIAETAFANDPLSPVRQSEVANVLRENAFISVGNGSLERAYQGGEECLVFDCTTRSELRAIAELYGRRNQTRVLSGSAAFAEELPWILSLPRTDQQLVDVRSPILLVNGSLNPRSFEQVAAAKEAFRMVQVKPEIVCGMELEGQIPCGNTMLYSVAQREDYDPYRERALELGMPESRLHAAVAAANGRCVKHFLENGAFRTLVVFGGDTLMGIAREMGWSAFVPRGELEAGVTLASPMDSELMVLSKAGGFGDRDALRRVIERVRN